MTHRRPQKLGLAAIAALSCLNSQNAQAQMVEVTTPLGVIMWQLHPEDAPLTVANLLRYINDGDYVNSVLHRTARISNAGVDVIQGGGFILEDTGVVADLEEGAFKDTLIDQGLTHYGVFDAIPTDAPIQNEFNQSNLRGTVAMARFGGQPNSATSQWYINLNDTNNVLDGIDGGFTVFATVVQGLDVADDIYDLLDVEILNPSNPGNAFPLSNTPILDTATPPTLEQGEAVTTSFRVIPDFDGDFDVDGVDLAVMFGNFTGPGGGAFGTVGDLDGDGDVDGVDFGKAFGAFTGPAAPATVPEPGTAALLALGGLALVRRRRD